MAPININHGRTEKSVKTNYLLTRKDCKELQTNMPKNVVYKDLTSKVDITNSEDRILYVFWGRRSIL